MLNDKRKEELEILLRWAACSDDKYYFNMPQDVFDGVLTRDKDGFKPYIYQREVGFEKFKAEMAEKLSAIHLADEIHYMLADYNFDDSPWVIEQLIMNPVCDIESARIVYWKCQPTYYYNEWGSPANCPIEFFDIEKAKLMVKIEEKANSAEFKSGQVSSDGLYEQPIGLDFSSEPYCNIPTVLRVER